jgi:hypothetical protein
MSDLQGQCQAPLSSQENLQELEEQDLKEVTGGGLGDLTKSLLSDAEKIAAKGADDAKPHPNNGTYEAPGWTQNPYPGSRVNVAPASWYKNTSIKPNH